MDFRKLENYDTSEIVVLKNQLQKHFVPIVRESSEHTRETIFLTLWSKSAEWGEEKLLLLLFFTLALLLKNKNKVVKIRYLVKQFFFDIFEADLWNNKMNSIFQVYCN